MTHFLARLVERTRGEAPRIEPIVAPRFAPTSVAEVVPESVIGKSSKRSAEAQTEPPFPFVRHAANEPSVPLVRQIKDESVAPEQERAERAGEVLQEKLLLPLEEIAPTPSPVVRRREPEIGPAPVSRNGATRGIARSGATPPAPGRAAGAGDADPGRIVSSHEQRAASPHDSANERPIVRVTIGRIEVRAASASAAPVKKATPPAAPKLTLDSYLKSRREGAR